MKNKNLNGQLTELVTELVHNGLPLEQARKQFEKEYIVASLRGHGGNVSRTAQALGLHRNTLRNKVAALGIELDAIRSSSS